MKRKFNLIDIIESFTFGFFSGLVIALLDY